ncbi:MAG: DUF3108 domain-containing protein, partial [Bryocella sp.]
MKANKFSVALAISFACLSSPLAAPAQLFSRPAPPPPVQKPIPTLQPPQGGFTYPNSETLNFSVDWRVFTAGMAQFQLTRVGDVEKISATADSTGAVNLLFQVIDRFQAGLNTRTGCSTGFSKQLQEGRRKIASDLRFDYERGRQTEDIRNLVKGTATHKEANIPACVTDTLSAMFYAQSQPLIPGQDI